MVIETWDINQFSYFYVLNLFLKLTRSYPTRQWEIKICSASKCHAFASFKDHIPMKGRKLTSKITNKDKLLALLDGNQNSSIVHNWSPTQSCTLHTSLCLLQIFLKKLLRKRFGWNMVAAWRILTLWTVITLSKQPSKCRLVTRNKFMKVWNKFRKHVFCIASILYILLYFRTNTYNAYNLQFLNHF